MGELIPTILVIFAGLVTWYLKDNSEKLKFQREKLLDDKGANYQKVLDPMIRSLAGAKNKMELDKAIKQVKSYEYKKDAFQLMMFGSDDVVKAYNDFFQYLYKTSDNVDSREMLTLLGNVILQIRKDLGNSKTMLSEMDMLRFMITDIDKL